MLKKLLATLAATLSLGAHAGITVQVEGTGRPVLLIPGLASGAGVWNETCPQLGVQCHKVQLPGFAGAPPDASGEAFLATQRDAIRAYLKEKNLQQVDIVGHSLGGNLALMLAAAEPERVRRVVLVDSLPFLAALRNPAATTEQARQMAAGMKSMMAAQKLSPEQLEQQQRQMAQGMARSKAGQDEIVRWALASDTPTVLQAMSEIWGGDFRPLLPQIQQPMLVLGAWAAYAPMGATQAGTQLLFERQYAGAKAATVRMSAQGFHFLMWDDREWLVNEVKTFLQ